MSNQVNRINWDYIEEWKQKEGGDFKCIWNAYGLPEIVNPIHTRYATDEEDVQPRWKTWDKIPISTTITGAFHSNRINPNHPQTRDEIYTSAREACLAGVPIVHIHVRDEAGYNVLDPELFHSVIDPLRREFPQTVFDGCMVPFQSGEWPKMIECLQSGLLDVTPINTVAAYCGDTLFCKPPHVMIEKTRLVQEYGVKPQIAIYSDGDIDNADRYLIKTGLLEKPYHWIILPTLPGGSPMQSARSMVYGFMHLYDRIMEIDPTSQIMVCAAGRASSYLATLAAMMGCAIRVGMEDTVWRWPHKDEMIKNNAEHFKAMKQLCALLGREVATPNEYRRSIGLPEK